MTFAFADPPYIGQAAKHYADHPDYAGEVDHAALLRDLVDRFPDGWALSLSSVTLHRVLDCCREAGLSEERRDFRVCAWVKPFCSFKPGVPVAYAWEPVIVRGGRKRDPKAPTIRDWVACNITLKKGLSGAKPEGFCFWLFEVLGMDAGDELCDLFPGTGGVMRAWERWQRLLRPQVSLFDEEPVSYAR